MNQIQRANLVIHPIRLRIITLLSKENMTTGNLAKKLPEIPQATLYRHIKKLETSQVIQIVSTQPLRGTVEKTYTLKNKQNIQLKILQGGVQKIMNVILHHFWVVSITVFLISLQCPEKNQISSGKLAIKPELLIYPMTNYPNLRKNWINYY
jgi:predicted transcriptional regulator